jgi:hypothetical protein
MAVGRVVIRHQAQARRARELRSERARRALKAQIRAERAAVRARWAPANDPRWLREASLTDTAVAWCVAVPYAGPSTEWFERSAESAVRNCERRLRELHPHAMARYDRLRGDGLHPVLAMGKAAPLFARSPDVRAHGTQPRSGALTRGSGLDHSWAAAEHGPAEGSSRLMSPPGSTNGATGRSPGDCRAGRWNATFPRSGKPSSVRPWNRLPACRPARSRS